VVVDSALSQTPPRLPTWLSPIQLRILPLTEKQVPKAFRIAEKIAAQGIRVDVDDRGESLAKKVREAETSWIPYIATIGPKEAKTGKLAVRIRGAQKVETKTVNSLVKLILKETKDHPTRPLTMPMAYSKRPGYRYFT